MTSFTTMMIDFTLWIGLHVSESVLFSCSTVKANLLKIAQFFQNLVWFLLSFVLVWMDLPELMKFSLS